MGVFSMFRRKGADASSEDVEAATAAEEAATEAADADGSDGVDGTDGAVAESAPVAAVVDIPKQQSAEAAADSTAGEGAGKE
ncbi:hypothetical protein [Streptomyces sp. Root66D1]|nr:hypothetical protein [Streptomyces sp. Root66D1]